MKLNARNSRDSRRKLQARRREEVKKLWAEGYIKKEIAAKLGVTHETIASDIKVIESERTNHE